MQAQLVTTGLTASVVARNTTTQTASSHIALRAPSISQSRCERWTDLPVEVVEQVMYWSMLQSGSSAPAMSFALTAKCFAQAAQSFRTSPWYQEARSVLTHERTMRWTCNFVRALGNLPVILAPRNLKELDLALENLESVDDSMRHALDIELQRHAEPDTDCLGKFRSYHGAALSLMTGVLEQTHDQVIEIARALPSNVCLYVEFSYQVFRQRCDHEGAADLLSRIAMTGRPTAFNLKWHTDLSTRPEALGAVLDVACGPGMVSFFHFGRTDDPDAMLRALCDRCHRLRDLKLVMFDCERAPARDSLKALVAAMEIRNSAARSRLTVVIDCTGLHARRADAAPVPTAEELAACAHAGLYFESLEFDMANKAGQRKVLASVNGEPVHAVLPQPRRAGQGRTREKVRRDSCVTS